MEAWLKLSAQGVEAGLGNFVWREAVLAGFLSQNFPKVGVTLVFTGKWWVQMFTGGGA